MRISKFRVLRIDGETPTWYELALPEDLEGEHWMAVDAFDWKTWSEWTGLLDKNGTRVFEGDIVQDGTHGHERRWLVFWREEFPGFYLRKVADSNYTGRMEWIDLMTNGNVGAYEIIGNQYEHPHLLKAEESV